MPRLTQAGYSVFAGFIQAWYSVFKFKRLRTRKSKLLSEEIFLRSPISEPGCGQFRKQANPGNSPMEALMFWHSMIALANHTLSVALRYYRVHRRISSPAHHPRNAFYKNIWRIWISRQDAPCSEVKTIRLQANRFEQTYSTWLPVSQHDDYQFGVWFVSQLRFQLCSYLSTQYLINCICCFRTWQSD